MNRFTLSLFALAVGGILSASAKDDVTSTYLTDAAISDEANWGGGNSSGGNHSRNDNGYWESWHNTFSLTQTTSELPGGYYRVSIQAVNTTHPSTNATLTATTSGGQTATSYITNMSGGNFAGIAGYFAGDKDMHRIGATVKVNEGETLTVSFGQTNNNEWVVYGQFKLEKLTDTEGENAIALEKALGSQTYFPTNGGNGYLWGVERYSTSAYTAATGKVIYTSLTGLPTGKYTVGLYANPNMAWIGAATGDNIAQIFANSVTQDVSVVGQTSMTALTKYTLENVVVTDGTLEVGIQNIGTGGNWYVFSLNDLTYNGEDLSDYESSFNEAVTNAKAVNQESPMNATVLSALKNAISTYGVEFSTFTKVDDVKAAITALNTATTNATTSIANYVTAKNYLDAASGLDEAGKASYTANETVAAVQTAYDARTLEAVTSDQITAMETALRTAAKAQTTAGADMTAAIVNPSFEESGNSHTVGWTLTNHGNAANNGNFGLATGSYFVERWTAGPGTLSDGTMTQTITGLPVGKYTLTAEAQNLQQGDASVTPTGFYLTANDNKSDAISNTAGTFKVENVVVTDGSLTIGSKLDGCTGNWVCVDNFKLTFVGALTKEEALHQQISQLVTTAKAITGTMSDAASTQLSAAITAGNNSTSVTDTTSLNTVVTQLNAAIAKANTSVASNALVASGIISTSSIEGWTCTNSNTFHVNTWSSEGSTDGSHMTTPFIENWLAKGGTLGEGQIYYTLEGLKAGTYYVSALARVLNESGGDVTGASFFVNDATDAITTANHASTCTNGIYKNVVLAVTVEDDGTLKFGFDLASPSFNWISFKDVKVGEVGTATLDETSTTAPEATTGYVTATLARTFAAGWNSLVLPFATTTEALGADEAASYAGTSNDTIKFAKTTELKANTPYLVHFAEGSAPTSVTFDVVQIAPADNITVVDANGQFNFVGTYAALAQDNSTIVDGDYIVVAAGIKRASGGNALKAFRAYFDAQTTAAKKMTLSIDGDVVTAIDGVSVDAEAADNAPAYNLAGQRVGKSYKGVVVKNGKKLIRK